MYYIPYMILKNQLKDQSKAKLIIEGVEVYFETIPQNGKWIIRAKIEYTSEIKAESLKETLETLDHVRLEEGYLRVYLEEGFVLFHKETHDLFSFDLFKDTMNRFMSTYDFWKSIVEDMIKSQNALSI